MKRFLIFLAVLALVPLANAADTGVLEKAKAEGKAAFYANITAVEPIMEAFEAKTGVKGEYTRISTSKYLATVLTEHQAGKLMADVLQAPLPVLQMLEEKGVFTPYRSPSAADYPEWDEGRRPDSGFRHRVRGLHLQQGAGQGRGRPPGATRTWPIPSGRTRS